jgi:hypothetical protein
VTDGGTLRLSFPYCTLLLLCRIRLILFVHCPISHFKHPSTPVRLHYSSDFTRSLPDIPSNTHPTPVRLYYSYDFTHSALRLSLRRECDAQVPVDPHRLKGNAQIPVDRHTPINLKLVFDK